MCKLSDSHEILSKNQLEAFTSMQLELYKSLPSDFKRVDVLPLFEAKDFKGGTIARFLNNDKIFKNYKYGYYRKIGK